MKDLFSGEKLYSGDFYLAAGTVLLGLMGICYVYSASYYYAIFKFNNPYHFLTDNLIWVGGGLLLFIFFGYILDYRVLKHLAVPIIIFGMILMVLLLTPLGQNYNNATRWLNFGFTVMPGEIIKFCSIVFVAAFYAEDPSRAKSFKKGTLRMGIFIVALIFLFFKQPNLSTGIIVCGTIVAMMFVAGLNKLWAIGAAGLGFIASIIIYAVPRFNYIVARITAFLDPFADAVGSGFQVVQSLLALGSGGVFGTGLGQSVQKTLYLPEPYNDFILAVIGEETGFAGVFVLLLLFLVLIWRCFRTAVRCDDFFGMMLASGISILISLQVILNVAVVTSSCPATGVFLPFISYGGNGTIIFMSLMGIMFNISRHEKSDEEEELE